MIFAASAARQTEEGLRQVTEAMTLVEKGSFRFYEAELIRLRGELLLMQPTPDAANGETCLQQAYDLAASQQAKSLELRAAILTIFH